MKRVAYCLIGLLISGIFFECTNKKNTFVTRTFHNITSRYNGFYWATESLKDGLYKIETDYKEDYSKNLSMFLYPDNVSSKTIYPEMDKAIKKASTVITRHAIIDKKTKKEVYGAVKWIDDNWLVIGKAHFYKREFFSGIEIFEFVAKTYKSKQKYEAYLWLIRSYNEIGTLSQSEPIISKLRNDKKFPKEFEKDLHALVAEFYLKQGLYDEASKELEKAIELTRNKKNKSRFSFILAQMFEAKKDNKHAIKYYGIVIAMKPNYEMVFNAKIKRSTLYDVKEEKAKHVKKDLLKMAKDSKNIEYLDVIYYTLGGIEEKEKMLESAMNYYKKSAKSSVNNLNQKALSYLKLADYSFDKIRYVDAGAYYDSTVAVLDKTHPNYVLIVAKQKSLNELILNLNIISYEDSLQKVVRMDSSTRNTFISKLIKKVEQEEERKIEEAEEKKLAAANELLNPKNSVLPTSLDNSWYFYNASIKSFGLNEFIKKFGSRKLEDNWRRSNKQTSLDPLPLDIVKKGDDTTESKSLKKLENDKFKPEFYLKDLPFGDSAISLSNKKIVEAYYQLGSIYREALKNHEKSMQAFDDMIKRFPKNVYEPNCWYQEYRMCNQDKNAKAQVYKNLLLNNYPNSEFVKILNDPDYINKDLQSKSELEQFYTETWGLFQENKFRNAFEKSSEGLTKYGGKSEFSARFALLRAICIGRLSGKDSMETALLSVISSFASDAPVKQKAQELLDYITSKKSGAIGTKEPAIAELFFMNDKVEHFWVCLLPKDFKGENSFKAKLGDFNTKYFSTLELITDATIYQDRTLVFVKTLTNKIQGLNYFDTLFQNDEPFVGATLDKSQCTLLLISQENFQKMLLRKKLTEYEQFFLQHYQTAVNK